VQALNNLIKTRLPGLFSRRFGGRPDQAVALDIGTSKVLAIAARRNEEGEWMLEGFGNAPSQGLKAGAVVNIEEAVESIRTAISEAEAMAECLIRNVIVGIAGSHTQSLDSTGGVPVRDAEITPLMVDQVLEAASAVKLPHDKQLLHALPQEFGIDDQYGIRTPLGMSGVRLDVRVHLVAVGASALHNLLKCARVCGLNVDSVVLGPLAAGEAVLEASERELGVCLVDIGGGTSDFAVYESGSVQYTGSIPVAGNHVTRDIAVALGTRIDDAEQLKVEYGSVLHSEEDAVLSVPGLGGRPDASVSSSELGDIVGARYTEIFELIDAKLRSSGHQEQMQGAGIVLTGGGVMMRDLDALAEKFFGLPVRIGTPRQHMSFRDNRFNKPLYSVGIGLLGDSYAWQPNAEVSSRTRSLFQRVREWF